MKKLIPVIVLAIILSFGMAYGQDVTFSVGLKTWYNDWEYELPGNTYDSDPVLMIGPSVSIKYDKFFGGVSLLSSIGKYEWSGGVEADRTDIDLIAGYMFHPRLGAFVGYKRIIAGFPGSDTYIYGPGVGLTGNYPVRDNIVLYGSFSYMFLDYEIDPGGTFDSSGASIEGGAAYIISPNWNASIGYKYQKFTGDFPAGDLDDTFSGLTLGAQYRF